jgi:hypothetical protein
MGTEHWGNRSDGTAMQGDNSIRQRLRELAARIATEQDHDKFTALVQEFNQLLDEEKQQPDERRVTSKTENG